MKDRLYSLREKWLLVLLFLASLASLFFFVQFRTLAFPEHNIMFTISREEAAAKAGKFIEGQNAATDDYKNATIFSTDNQSKTYLEREVGVADTSKLAANHVDLWNFNTRFFKPSQQEEFTVSYMPNGRLVGYDHLIAENDAGAKLSKEQAQQVAEKFLTQNVSQHITDWTLVSGESTNRPKRVDHTFVYEEKDFKVKDATYRLQVNVQGDQIGQYTEGLKVPETWQRQYDNETSQNLLAQTVAESFALLVFGLALTITFVIQFRNNNLRLRFGRKVAFATAVVGILAAFNSLPLQLYGYDTTVSWDAFVGELVISSIFEGLMEGFLVFVAFAAGESLYRAAFPEKLALETTFAKAFTTKSVNKALFIGTFVGIIFFTYEIGYYFLGKQIGFWSPAEINYDDIFSTAIPWVYPLFIGFSAAATEEGIFRLFGISFLKKYVKKTWIAILITAISWAFLHSNYPQSPWFVRGIELSFVGIIFGMIFVRYGILASLTAHYTFNALQTAIFFTTSGNWYSIISSTLISLVPFLLAMYVLGWAIRRGGFQLEQKEFFNSYLTKPLAQAAQKIKETGTEMFVYKPLGQKTILVLIILSLVSIFGFFHFANTAGLKQAPLAVDRQEALQKAESALLQKGVHTDAFQHVVTFATNEDSQAEDYILEKSNEQVLTAIYPEIIPTGYWTVRFFKPLQKEEYAVDVLPNGSIYQISHTFDEKAKGAKLSQQQALKVAKDYLVQQKNYKIENYTVVQNTADKKENRTDYYFEFEEKNRKVEDATFRTTVEIRGSEVAGFGQYLKLPEDWIREKEQTTTLDFMIGAVIGIIVLLLLSMGFRTFFVFTREKKIPFKFSFRLAGAAILFSIIGICNNVPLFYSNYDTSIPLSTFTIQEIVLSIVGVVVGFFMMSLMVGMFLALWKDRMEGYVPREKSAWEKYLRDSLIGAYLTPFILSGITIFITHFFLSHDTLKTVSNFDSLTGLDTYVPALSVMTSLPGAVIGLSLLGSLLLLLHKFFASWKQVLIFITIFILLSAIPQQRTLTEYIINIGEAVLLAGGGSLIAFFILRKNLLAYILLTYVALFMASGVAYLDQPKYFYMINGAILLFFALLPVLVYAGWKLKNRSVPLETPT
jgi:membrane protease YdiL (CAAX protease family)